VYKSRDHNVSSPTIFGDRLLIAGLTGPPDINVSAPNERMQLTGPAFRRFKVFCQHSRPGN
jgi:hypothetical protein